MVLSVTDGLKVSTNREKAAGELRALQTCGGFSERKKQAGAYFETSSSSSHLNVGFCDAMKIAAACHKQIQSASEFKVL